MVIQESIPKQSKSESRVTQNEKAQRLAHPAEHGSAAADANFLESHFVFANQEWGEIINRLVHGAF